MAIKVSATIVDIRTDTPRSTDVFFVDSNVWFWVGYTNASLSSRNNQSSVYPPYLNKSLAVNARLHKCTLSFSELAHSIERSEYDIFVKSSPGRTNLKKKDYRHDPTQRTIVVTEITNTWLLADAMTQGTSIEVNVSNTAIQNALINIQTQALDGYDLFMLEAVLAAGITSFITDDIDFGLVPGIQVFTANQILIKAARAQNQLVKR